MAAVAVAVAMAAAAGVVVAAGQGAGPEDDLTVVKRAVAQSTPVAPAEAGPVRTEGEEPPSASAPPRRTTGKEPTWLKVRVTEKGSGRKKVTINLPLALVRAIDDGSPIDFGCGGVRRRHCSIRLAEVLATLEAGQDIVEVDDEDALVRVWVE
jgi:hypothetical protein